MSTCDNLDAFLSDIAYFAKIMSTNPTIQTGRQIQALVDCFCIFNLIRSEKENRELAMPMPI